MVSETWSNDTTLSTHGFQISKQNMLAQEKPDTHFLNNVIIFISLKEIKCNVYGSGKNILKYMTIITLLKTIEWNLRVFSQTPPRVCVCVCSVPVSAVTCVPYCTYEVRGQLRLSSASTSTFVREHVLLFYSYAHLDRWLGMCHRSYYTHLSSIWVLG